MLRSEAGNGLVGRQLGPYVVTGKLGKGGMGVVYQAEDTKLNRFVALKFLPVESSRDRLAAERACLVVRS